MQIEWKIPEALPSAGSPGLSRVLVLRVQMANNWTRKKMVFCPWDAGFAGSWEILSP